MIFEQPTIVISPLIALMADQERALKKHGVPVIALHSRLRAAERRAALERLKEGGRLVVLTTPETLQSAATAPLLERVRPALLCIDEAHCISEWGHDFRPAYLRLGNARKRLGNPPVLALTATATPRVREDIAERLRLDNPRVLVAPAHRENLGLTVDIVPGAAKFPAAARRIKRLQRPGIIYCATTTAVDEVSGALGRARIPVTRYHGKMRAADRDAAQRQFMNPSRRLIMVATTAFGMGIDKPNIRYILHYQAPGSLEQYVQEIGRAGRDGRPAHCILLFDPADLEIHEHLQAQSRPSVRHLERLEAALTAWTGEERAPTAETLAYSAGVPARICEVLLSDLEEAGSVERDEDGSIAIVVPPEAFKTGVRDLVAKLKIFRYEGERRLRLIADYANSEECRSVFIRRYFGEEYPPRCGTCDRCRADRVVAEQASPAPISRPKSEPRAQDRRQSPARNGDGDANALSHEEPAPLPVPFSTPTSMVAGTENLPPLPGHEMLTPTEATDVFPFDNSYARLPERFFARLPPTPVAAPRLIRLNEALARHLRLDPDKLTSPEGVAVLAGNRVPRAGEPLAMAYAGHQFGAFVPQLGDGRAILLGEVVDADGMRRDIQLKGSGPTPFSRNGDGRAALGPVLREYIVSEAMAALGIPTTRSLAAVMTGETVRREMPLPGAVLTRVASSHIRVGTFQFFAVRGDVDAIRHLADHVIARHYPEAAGATNRYRALLELVIAPAGRPHRQMAARWLHPWRHEHRQHVDRG